MCLYVEFMRIELTRLCVTVFLYCCISSAILWSRNSDPDQQCQFYYRWNELKAQCWSSNVDLLALCPMRTFRCSITSHVEMCSSSAIFFKFIPRIFAEKPRLLLCDTAITIEAKWKKSRRRVNWKIIEMMDITRGMHWNKSKSIFNFY